MSDAVGEEYKHFSMDLEFLLRTQAEVARDRPGRAVPGRRHRRARRGRRGGRRRRRGTAAEEAAPAGGVARDRQPAMSHLLREHAPITEAGWKLIDEEARERLTPGLAARRLVDFDGPHGWEHSATNLGRVADWPRRTAMGSRPGSGGCCRWSSSARRFSVSREELRAGDRGAGDVDFASLDEAAHRSSGRRTQPSSTAGRRPASRASRRRAATTRSPNPTTSATTRRLRRRRS